MYQREPNAPQKCLEKFDGLERGFCIDFQGSGPGSSLGAKGRGPRDFWGEQWYGNRGRIVSKNAFRHDFRGRRERTVRDLDGFDFDGCLA